MTTTPSPSTARGIRLGTPWWWLLLPLVANAFTRGLWAPDEPRYAEVAREAVERGDYLVMHICGGVYPDKPPLLFWIAGILGRLSGWNEGVMRLVSIAAMAGTALLVARLAARFWGRLEAELAPAIFLGCAMVSQIGGRLQIDPLLCFLVTAALVLLSEETEEPRARARNALQAGLCVGLGVLAKGPVAFVLVGLPLLVWRWLLGRPKVRVSVPMRKSLLGAVALAILLPLAWALAAILREPSLREQFLFEQHVGKAFDGTRHANPFWKYLVSMPALLLPWTVPALAGLGEGWRSWRARRRHAAADEGLVRASSWLLVLFLFFSLLVSKRDLYLLPAYPAAALLAARILARGGGTGRLARRAGAFAAGLVGLVGLALVAGASAPLWLDEARPYASDAWRPLVAGCAWLVGFTFVLRAVRGAGTAGSGGTVGWSRALLRTWAFAGALMLLLLFPVVDRSKSARILALRVAERPERPTAIPTIGVQPEGFRFYGRVPTVRDHDLEAALLRDGGDMLGLVRERDWERRVDPELRARLRILGRQRVGSREVLLVGRKPAGDARPPD